MGQWEIQGKTVLITGGASGLGAMYAEAFLKEGAKIMAIIDIAEETGKATAARLNSAYPGKVSFFKADVGKEEDIAVSFDKVVAELGHVDVLVNNAGIMSDSPTMWRKACDVNWQGLVSYTMKAQKHMSKDEGGKGGTIINISSVAGVTWFKQMPAYAGSKAAVLHFTLSLAHGSYYDVTGVRLAVVLLGATDTALLQGLKERAYNEKIGTELEEEYAVIKQTVPPQKPESAVAALIKIYKDGGTPCSVWWADNNRPIKDVTPMITNIHDQFMQLLA